MLQWLYAYVASFCSQVRLFGCYISFRHMLQVFYLDITYDLRGFQVFFRCFCKYFRCMFQMFHLPSDIRCKCFVWILHMFYVGFKCFSGVFASISDACFKCFICLQTYVASVHLDVSKVVTCCISLLVFLLPYLGVSSSRRWLGIRHPLPYFSMLVPFWVAWAPCGRAKRRGKTDCMHRCPDTLSVWTSGR